MAKARTPKPLSLFADDSPEDDGLPGSGYAAFHVGDVDIATRGGRDVADTMLRSAVGRELARPEWRTVPAPVRAAYLRLYGSALAPRGKLGPHDRIAVALAIAGGPGAVDEIEREDEIDHDAAERAAIEGY